MMINFCRLTSTLIDNLTTQVICLEENNENFVLPDDDIKYERAEHDDILSLATWGKYLNPLEWFKGGKPGWVEGVVIAVALILLTIIVGIIVKLVRVFNCIFKCLTCCRQSKENYAKVRERALHRRMAGDKVKSVIPAKRPNSRSLGREDSLADDLHYIVVNDNTQENEYETLPRRVRFNSNQFFTSKKWAF